MDFQALVLLALKISIMLLVLGIGLQANFQDATHLLRRPRELVRALLAMNVLMPVFALMLGVTLDLNPAVKIALAALSFSPMPPILPRRAMKAGGTERYSIGLLVATAVFSIILVPLLTELFSRFFSFQNRTTIASVVLLVATTVLGPLILGMVINSISPALAERLAKPLTTVATVVLLLALLPILIRLLPLVLSLVGNGTILTVVAFVLVGIAVGHLLGGPDPENRTVLALACATRHPAIAMTIAHANFPQEKLSFAAILLYMLVSLIASAPYLLWTKKQHVALTAKT
jgi:BASS family bile acid:Na+ symporter